MRELHDESVEKKKDEIRKRLNLPKDALERTSELKEKYTIKASARKDRLDAPLSKPLVLSSSSSSSSSAARRDKLDRPSYHGRYERSRSREKYDRVERDRRGPDKYERKSRERDHERDHDRHDRHRHERPHSRGSFHEDSPIRGHFEHRGRGDEREPADFYAPPNPYKWHANQPKSHYPPKMHYYGRDMPGSAIPKYEEPPEIEEPESNDEPLTVVTVLRLLSALEELLGPSLGPKIVELLAKALALEKVKANSADDLLLNDDNCVLFETIKEKLKAQLMTDMVERNRMKAVKRAIKNIAGVIHLANEREKNKTPEEKQQDALLKKSLAVEKQSNASSLSSSEKKPAAKSPEEEKREIAKKLAAALVAQGKTNVSNEELETLVNYYYEQRKAKESAAQAASATDTSSSATTAVAAAKSSASQLDGSPVNSDIGDDPAIDLTEEMNDSKRENDEFDLPQDTSHALESLTDADLQTLLQNFEDLSNEEQQHLHTYMKKLESSNPARVEKLRKYVHVAFDLQRSDANDSKHRGGLSPERYDTQRLMDTSKSQQRSRHQSDPYSDMFYDDSKDASTKAVAPPGTSQSTIVDSDDDDYSYDDLCKAASKNVKNQQLEHDARPQRSPDTHSLSDGGDSVNRHDQFILGGERNNHYDDNDSRSNMSRMSGGGGGDNNTNSRPALNDTESIIANLMGSLKNNVQSRNLLDRNLGGGADPLDSDGAMQRAQIQKNVPFYMQQQSQSAYAAPNPMYSNDMHSQNVPYASANQYGNNAYGNQNPNYNLPPQRITNNIPLNIPTFGQQQHQQQQPTLTNQQAALLAQFSQQQNRRQAW